MISGPGANPYPKKARVPNAGQNSVGHGSDPECNFPELGER